MNKMTMWCVLAGVSAANFVQAGDLVLPGEKWVAGFDKYVCAAFGEAVARPDAFEKLNVKFEGLTTDSTLDNALLKATFESNGKVCRYNAILLADNDAATSRLIQSIAYDPAATDGSAYAACNAGKSVIDAAFQANAYLYYGHPHNLAFMLSGIGAEAICGSDNGLVGANFVVKGRIQP